MKAIEREYERIIAGYVAREITKARDLWRRVEATDAYRRDEFPNAKGQALDRAVKECEGDIGFYIATSENVGRFLRLLTKAVEGKPIWSKNDAAINEVMRKYPKLKTIAELADKLAVVRTQLGINKTTKTSKHDRDALRRRLQARGRGGGYSGRKKLPRSPTERNRGKISPRKAATLGSGRRSNR